MQEGERRDRDRIVFLFQALSGILHFCGLGIWDRMGAGKDLFPVLSVLWPALGWSCPTGPLSRPVGPEDWVWKEVPFFSPRFTICTGHKADVRGRDDGPVAFCLDAQNLEG